ncbi:ATP-dependent RNA helicase DDX24 isoform X2 [Hyalella azteca]|uniref:ATP-dependent RNA helicase n=1 Tax=Hyalella azteca TaxID=294128 RepID=A0A8B7PKS8_HYAAZ|nr:ATP-dependent RNA helicase DDX24 isoform X2 [Hyalella azteca]
MVKQRKESSNIKKKKRSNVASKSTKVAKSLPKTKGKSTRSELLAAKILAHKTKNEAIKLMQKPVKIDNREFTDLSLYEEVNELNVLGVDEESGAAYTEDWKKGSSSQGHNHKTLKSIKLVKPPEKLKKTTTKKLTNKHHHDLSADNEIESLLDPSDVTLKKKKAKKVPVVKSTYDKPAITNGKKPDTKDSGIDDISIGSSPASGRPVDVSAWDDLGIPEPLLDVISELGFSTPTQIQALSIPPAIRGGKDILGAAETGSGKTLAFGIPIIAGVHRDRLRRQEKQRQKDILSKLSEETQARKRKRAQAMDSDEEDELGFNSGNTNHESDDESEGANESGDEVEEYLFNGPDGVLDVDYSELEERRKDTKKRVCDQQNTKSADDSEDDSNTGEDDGITDEDDNSTDEDGNESDEEGGELSEAEATDDSDLDDEQEINSEEERESDSGNDLEINSDAEQSLQSDDDEDHEDEQNSDAASSDDLGSDDESDIEYDENDDGEDLKCVRVINNVKFPFEEIRKPKFVETSEEKLVRALILTPTRELAVQINRHLSPLCERMGVTSCVLVGGLDAYKQKRILRRTRPELVVATPGRLWELIHEGVDHLKELRGVRYLAIDEADRMIDKKNFEEVHKIVRLLGDGTAKNKASSNRQTFVFSATLTLVHQLPDRKLLKNKAKKKEVPDEKSNAKLQHLAKMVGMKPSAKILDVTRKHATAQNLTECRINCEREEKDEYLFYFLVRHPGRTIVFCNSIEATKRLKSLFTLLKCNAQELHASMHQKQRLRNLQQFSNSDKSLLITTDVSARGLDIKGVEHVVHYQVPFTAESYVHRSGRTARGSNSGLSLVFVEPKEVLRFRQICKTLGRTDVNDIPLFAVNEGLLEQVQERVQLATALEKLLHQIRRQDEDSKDQSELQEAGLNVSDDEMDQEDLYLLPSEQQRRIRSGGRKGEVKILQRRLNEALKAPLVGAMFSFRNPTSRTALAAGLGTDAGSIPSELIGVNRVDTLTEDPELSYIERYDYDHYGDHTSAAPNSKSSMLLKKHRKDMAKLTKKLLKPEESLKEMKARREERILEKNKRKLEKKREKRKKRRMSKKVSK